MKPIIIGPKKVHLQTNGKANVYLLFMKTNHRHELKLKPKGSYFEAVLVAEIRQKAMQDKQKSQQNLVSTRVHSTQRNSFHFTRVRIWRGGILLFKYRAWGLFLLRQIKRLVKCLLFQHLELNTNSPPAFNIHFDNLITNCSLVFSCATLFC